MRRLPLFEEKGRGVDRGEKGGWGERLEGEEGQKTMIMM